MLQQYPGSIFAGEEVATATEPAEGVALEVAPSGKWYYLSPPGLTEVHVRLNSIRSHR